MIDKNDVRRKRFEEWMKNKYMFTPPEDMLQMYSSGSYMDERTDLMWQSFLLGCDFGWHKGFSSGVSEK